MLYQLFKITATLLLTFLSFGQGNEIDSIKNVLSTTITKTERIQLLLKLSRLSDDSLEINSFIETAKREIAIADFREKPSLQFKVGSNYYKLLNLDSALLTIQPTIDLFVILKEYERAGESARMTAKIYQKKSLYELAIENYRLAINNFKKGNNVKKQIDCLNGMGVIQKNLENYSEALPLYHSAYELARINHLPLKKALSCLNIGVLLKKQRKFQEAIKYYKKAETVYLEEDDYRGLANVYNNLGNVYRLEKNYDAAITHYFLAIDNRNKQGDKKLISYTYNNIAITYQEQGNLIKALDYLKLSEKLKLQNNEIETLTSSYLNFAEIYLQLKDKRNFNKYSDLTEQLTTKFKQNSIRRHNLILKSKFSANQEDYRTAYLYLSRVYNELDTLDIEEHKAMVSVLQAEFERDQSKNEVLELSDAIKLLDQNKRALENKQQISLLLISVLAFVIIGLLILAYLFYKKQLSLKIKSEELVNVNKQLSASTISVEEKELLLKEIHHRVKNNLQIIKSLARLQNSGETNGGINSILKDFELRVSSMALVHESLYRSKDLAKVNVPNYYKELVENLIEVYKQDVEVNTKISISINELGIDTLVPLGLVSTEIISNSLKYGVNNNENGLITVNLQQVDSGEFELYIGDNGTGFDMNIVKEKNTLGIELIHTLVEQLDGSLSFLNENGAYYRIRFSAQEK